MARVRVVGHGEPDPSERLRRVLSVPADESGREALLEAVGDVSLDVARQALRQLVPLAGPGEIARLREQIFELDIGIVADVAAALRHLDDDRATAAAIAHLAEQSGSARQKATLALRELQDPAARDALLDALADPATPVRRIALEALSRLPSEPETIRACRESLRDDDPSVRIAAVAAVAQLDPVSATTLRGVAGDSQPSVRRAVAAAAGALDLDSLAALLGDREPEVRVAALNALGRHPRPQLTPLLLKALKDESWHVRRAAADALGGCAEPSTGLPLVQALIDPHPLVRGRALIALERLLGGELDPTLGSALTAAEAPLRRALVEILGRRGRFESLLGLLRDRDAGVRIALVHALENLPGRQARRAIEELSGDPDVAVRHAATVALAKIGAHRPRRQSPTQP